ncbi:MAG: hypothetical protein HY847_12540 [Betaproteobacteria bacterium]|nr:hypothetical protein [Betaproteobacteria bacterium]
MLITPKLILRLNGYFSRWISSRKLETVLDRPRLIERFLYRHHQLVGAAVLLGALVVLYVFLFRYNVRTISFVVPPEYWWLTDALLGMLQIGSVLAALVGGIIMTKPSLLRDIENSVNRWISTDSVLGVFDTANYSIEQHILDHSRFAGVFILIGSGYTLVVLGKFLFRSVA